MQSSAAGLGFGSASGGALAEPCQAPVAAVMRQRLERSMYVELRGAECRFDSGVLTLTGEVPSFYLKQVAFALTENIDGVERVENQIEVVDLRARSRFRDI
jgi:hypothetical protein